MLKFAEEIMKGRNYPLILKKVFKTQNGVSPMGFTDGNNNTTGDWILENKKCHHKPKSSKNINRGTSQL